jgi:hypothetical protein
MVERSATDGLYAILGQEGKMKRQGVSLFDDLNAVLVCAGTLPVHTIRVIRCAARARHRAAAQTPRKNTVLTSSCRHHAVPRWTLLWSGRELGSEWYPSSMLGMLILRYEVSMFFVTLYMFNIMTTN